MLSVLSIFDKFCPEAHGQPGEILVARSSFVRGIVHDKTHYSFFWLLMSS